MLTPVFQSCCSCKQPMLLATKQDNEVTCASCNTTHFVCNACQAKGCQACGGRLMSERQRLKEQTGEDLLF